MKVLYYNQTGTVGGAERMLLVTLAGLDAKRFDLSLLCPREGELRQCAFETGTPVRVTRSPHVRPIWRPVRLYSSLRSFLNVLRSFRRQVEIDGPHLIHANSVCAGLTATLATIGMKTPVVWHLHSMLPRYRPCSSLIRWAAALSSRTHLLAPSRAVAERFRGRLLRLLPGKWRPGASRMHVLPNGIELQRYVRDVDSGRAIRRELGIPERAFTLGIVGTITPQKGQRELIEVFARADDKDAVLLIVGAPADDADGKYLESLQKRAWELNVDDRVYFLGHRSDVPAVMQTLDLLVLNSQQEPFGLVLVEAMACGVPVVATAVDGVLEIVEHGKTGWLVPPGDREALRKAIHGLRCNRTLRRQLSTAACERSMARFTANRYLAGLADFYRSVLGTQREAAGSAPLAPSFKGAVPIALRVGQDLSNFNEIPSQFSIGFDADRV